MTTNCVLWLGVKFDPDTPAEFIDIFKKNATDFGDCGVSLYYDKNSGRYSLSIQGKLQDYCDKLEILLNDISTYVPKTYIGHMYYEDETRRKDAVYILNTEDGIRYERMIESPSLNDWRESLE